MLQESTAVRDSSETVMEFFSSPTENTHELHFNSFNHELRSANEGIVDTGNKFRQLPCRTFISVGSCPYRERCVYLHDPRCVCRDAKTKTRRKNKDDVVLDSLFWPIMPYNAVASKLDNNRQPHVIQPYQVPPPQNDQFRRHDEAVYSMWSHFVDFCIANSESQYAPNADLTPVYAAPDLPINAYTKLSRFPVFRVLSGSKGREIMREEFDGAELGDWRGMNANSADFGAKAVLRKIFDGDYHSFSDSGDIPRSISPNGVHLLSPLYSMGNTGPEKDEMKKLGHFRPAVESTLLLPPVSVRPVAAFSN